MYHIKNLNINRFRGISDLIIENLSQINILLGKNNAGKTSILEAISVLEYPHELGNYIKATSKRDSFGSGKLSYYSSFINTFNKNRYTEDLKIKIKALVNDGNIGLNIEGEKMKIIDKYGNEIIAFEGVLEFYKHVENIIKKPYKEDIHIKTKTYIDENTETFKMEISNIKGINVVHIASFDYMIKDLTNDVVKSGNKKELIDIIKVFDKDITGLEMIGEKEKTVPYIEHKNKGLMPLSTYGDGLRKVLLMASAVVQAKDGVLLIDEIETGIHYSALIEIFKWLIKACKQFNVQVFMTSHSIEVVDAMIESLNDSNNLKEILRVITLKRNIESNIKVRVLDGLEVYKSREDYNLELR